MRVGYKLTADDKRRIEAGRVKVDKLLEDCEVLQKYRKQGFTAWGESWTEHEGEGGHLIFNEVLVFTHEDEYRLLVAYFEKENAFRFKFYIPTPDGYGDNYSAPLFFPEESAKAYLSGVVALFLHKEEMMEKEMAEREEEEEDEEDEETDEKVH